MIWHTVLIDTCTGEDKGYPPPMDFPKQPWLDGFAAAGLRFEDIDYVFCAAGTRCCATAAGCRHFRKLNIFSTKANMPPGRNRPSAAKNPRRRRAAMCFATIASRSLKASFRPGAARRWTAISSTIRFGFWRSPAISPDIAASISARADSTRSWSATSCTTPCNVASPIGRRSSTGIRNRPRGRGESFSPRSPGPANMFCRSIFHIRRRG